MKQTFVAFELYLQSTINMHVLFARHEIVAGPHLQILNHPRFGPLKYGY